MDLDAPICLCFDVSRRKIVRFIKVEKPVRASQLSECFNAGTGCGWCRQLLERLHQQHSAISQLPCQPAASSTSTTASIDQELDSLDSQLYQDARQVYRDQKRAQAQASDGATEKTARDPPDSTSQN